MDLNLPNILALLVIALIVGGAIAYVIKAKRSGKRCIGCPDSSNCHSDSCNGSCKSCHGSCHCQKTEDHSDSAQ